ncbi:hypothetical protein INT47_011785 [Mucor saturninus]|uniref:Uncharacterized protein n=1 Tax=Mucor saturninus TaxID=64648 RepID=A0A8H7V589_9FUNG|nr:hypothetical protein INT47_011785 [Mucor saturninus]
MYSIVFLLFLFPHVFGYEQDVLTSTANISDPVNQDIYNSKELFTREPNVTDINEVVQVKLYCEIDNTHCAKVQAALVSAAYRLSDVLNFRNQIVIKASYYSFCLNRCSNSTLGWGTPSSQFTLISLDEADSNFIYPQALAKQIRAPYTDISSWASYDLAVDINHDIYNNEMDSDGIGGFYFANDSSSIEDHQVDLEYVVLHQMIHGLGMLSSWAPYFSDSTSPFQELLKGLIPSDNLKMMTPSPNWFVKHDTGPAYVTGFQPNLIFDKFLKLFIPAKNITADLVEYSFDMQGFCIADSPNSFIVNFMNSFLNNATQSSRAKAMYVSLSTSKTLTFRFTRTNNNHTLYNTNPYLNSTYDSIQLMTGPDVLSSLQEAYYRPGVSISHVDDDYSTTPDFLMTHHFVKGKTLQMLIEDGYTDIPIIKYNLTISKLVNITTVVHNTTVNTTEKRDETIEYVYKSAIGPGILRILETIGYSTVLTNTNYTTSVIKTNKPDSDCDDIDGKTYSGISDGDSMPLSTTSLADRIQITNILQLLLLLLVTTALLYQ